MNQSMFTNVGSNRTKHTDYARWTSIMRKLDNQVEREKLREKKVLAAINSNS